MVVPVAVGIVEKNEKHLLIRRNNEVYNQKLALPGGKIEDEEHAASAVSREIEEETGIEVDTVQFCGVVSEHLNRDNGDKSHFLIHVFEANATNYEIESGNEGSAGWHKMDDVSEEIVSSDIEMIRTVQESDNSYFECMIKNDTISYFEPK